MRRLAPFGLAAIGLSLALPAPSRAGTCPTCDGSAPTAAPVAAGRPSLLHRHKRGALCEECQIEAAIRQAGPPQVLLSPGSAPMAAPCTSCGTQPAGPPGYAMLGGPSVYNGDPAPIGVVQAGYQPTAAGTQLAGMPSATTLPAGSHPGLVPAGPIGWLPQRSRRPAVVSHLLGLDGIGQWRRARAEWQAQRHAALPLGQPGAVAPVADLPASVVRAQGGH